MKYYIQAIKQVLDRSLFSPLTSISKAAKRLKQEAVMLAECRAEAVELERKRKKIQDECPHRHSNDYSACTEFDDSGTQKLICVHCQKVLVYEEDPILYCRLARGYANCNLDGGRLLTTNTDLKRLYDMPLEELEAEFKTLQRAAMVKKPKPSRRKK